MNHTLVTSSGILGSSTLVGLTEPCQTTSYTGQNLEPAFAHEVSTLAHEVLCPNSLVPQQEDLTLIRLHNRWARLETWACDPAWQGG